MQSKSERLAAERGSDAASLAREVIERFVDYDAWFVREVEKGLGQIARGQVLRHDQVGSRLEKLLSERQARPGNANFGGPRKLASPRLSGIIDSSV